MSYGPHQLKMLKQRRDKTVSRTQEYYKTCSRNGDSGLKNNIKSFKVNESLLYSIRRRLKSERKQRVFKIIVFSIAVLMGIIVFAVYCN